MIALKAVEGTRRLAATSADQFFHESGQPIWPLRTTHRNTLDLRIKRSVSQQPVKRAQSCVDRECFTCWSLQKSRTPQPARAEAKKARNGRHVSHLRVQNRKTPGRDELVPLTCHVCRGKMHVKVVCAIAKSFMDVRKWYCNSNQEAQVM